jgi:hypothetical protein
METDMKIIRNSKLAGMVVAATLSVGAVGVSAGTASADRPFEDSDVDIFTDENPCTGNEMEITINFVARVHLHGDRVVVSVSRTGTTSDGYAMDHSVESFVVNGHVARGSFSDNWVNDDGSRFQAKGSFVDNLNKGELMVDRFRLRCIKP